MFLIDTLFIRLDLNSGEKERERKNCLLSLKLQGPAEGWEAGRDKSCAAASLPLMLIQPSQRKLEAAYRSGTNEYLF